MGARLHNSTHQGSNPAAHIYTVWVSRTVFLLEINVELVPKMILQPVLGMQRVIINLLCYS